MKRILTAFIFAALLLVVGCNKESKNDGIVRVGLAAGKISETTLEFTVSVINATNCSYLWLKENTEPSIDDIIANGTTIMLSGMASRTIRLDDLEPNTTYHIYVAASNFYSTDTAYLRMATVSDISGDVNPDI